MSFEEFPENIKKDVEDQSLEILDVIRDDVIVIGGWAVRALVGEIHARYTMDVDCVGDTKDWAKIEMKLKSFGLKPARYKWGFMIIKNYEPLVSVQDALAQEAQNLISSAYFSVAIYSSLHLKTIQRIRVFLQI